MCSVSEQRVLKSPPCLHPKVLPIVQGEYTSSAMPAQIKVVPIGRVHSGNEMTTTYDPDNVITLGLFGRGTDTYRVGSKLGIGDIGGATTGGMNVFLGEFGILSQLDWRLPLGGTYRQINRRRSELECDLSSYQYAPP